MRNRHKNREKIKPLAKEEDMPIEDPSNIGFLCSKHAPKPLGLRKVPNDIIGRFVKKGFPAVTPEGFDQIEHMWVKVQSVQGNTLFGTLNSDPLYDCGLSYEDPVQVDIEEVEEIVPPFSTN